MLKKNTIAVTLRWIGYLFAACGVIVAIGYASHIHSFNANLDGLDSLSMWTALYPLIGGLITCFAFVGFSEVVQLLHEIRYEKR